MGILPAVGEAVNIKLKLLFRIDFIFWDIQCSNIEVDFMTLYLIQ